MNLCWIDPRQAESPFFSHGSNPYEDIRNHQIAPTTMVRYLPQQYPNECSEPDEAMEAVDAQEIQQVSKISKALFSNQVYVNILIILAMFYFLFIIIFLGI